MEKTLFETDFAIYYERFINRVSSLFFVNRWRRGMVEETLRLSETSDTVLDFCSGVGDVAEQFLKVRTPKLFINCDISLPLLRMGRERLRGKAFFVRADNRWFPVKGGSIDILFTSFCVRHSPEPERTVDEAFRSLKGKGVWGNIEFFRPESKPIGYRLSHAMFLSFLKFNMLIAPKYAESFREFERSIEGFYSVGEFKKLMESKGFKVKTVKPLFNGLAHMTVAVKP